MSTLPEFFVYIYLNPLKPNKLTYGDFISFLYEPFYVGKGKGNRHLSGLKDKYNPFKKNIIKSIHTQNLTPIVIKIIDNIIEDKAFKIEEHLVNLIGRRDLNEGSLSNLSNGGEGVSGRSIDQKKKLSERFSGENNPMYGKGYLIMGDKNPMKDPKTIKKTVETKKKNGVKPLLLTKKQRKLNSNRMKENNPMKNPETAKMVAQTIKDRGSLSNGNNGRAKSCMVEHKVYSCVKEAELETNLSRYKILKKIENNVDGYCWLA